MNRRQLALIIILNALISLVIALSVVWVVERRRPDPETLAAFSTPIAAPVIAPTFTATPVPAALGDQAAPTAAPAPSIAGEDNIYVVQAGDSLLGIAQSVGVSMQAILDANNLSNPDFIFSGQRLVIPQPGAQPLATPAQPATPVVTTQPANQGIRIASFTGSGALNSEAVQVANDSDLAVNLQGWRLEKENGPVYTFGNISLFPGSGVVVYTGPGTDTSVALYWNQAAPIWAPGNGARLVNPQGQEVSRLTVP